MTRSIAPAARLSWSIAMQVADLPRGSVFAASSCAVAGVRLAQDFLGCRLALSGRGGAYDLHGILALHARHWLSNQQVRGFATLSGVFETLSEPSILLASPGQVDGAGNANLSTIGDHAGPKVAFGGTRGLPDAGAVSYVLPAHNPRQLVKKVDFISTGPRSTSPSLLFTELCVMRFDTSHGHWRLLSLSPGVSFDEVRSRTGFDFDAEARPAPTPEPPAEAIAALAAIDPLGLCELDFITDRKAQSEAMARIYAAEMAMLDGLLPPAERPRGWF